MNKQERVQKQFKDFILNDIFWFDKSELNFGIYKIFRQKEKLIRESIDRIVSNIEGSLSSTPDNALEALKKKLIDNYIPGIKAKELPLDTLDDIKRAIREYGNGHKEMLLEELGRLETNEEHNATKVYEYLYQFFNLYYEKGDFGYTPRSFRTYTVSYKHEDFFIGEEDKCSNETSVAAGYNGEETLFTWKTFDSYYIKSNKFLNSVSLTLTYQGEEYVINTSIVDKDEDIRDDKKIKQYRLVSVEKNGKSINLKFNISDHATPKHTIYLLLLSVIHENVSFLDYNGMFQDPKTKDYFEKLPFNDTKLTASLFDDAQSKILAKFKQFIQDEDFARYVLEFKRDRDGNIKSVADIFKSEIKGEEDKTQLKSKVSKLLIKKKDYAKKLYSAKAAKSFLGTNRVDFDNHRDVEELFEKDPKLSFFYRLDRGINMFYAGVDSDYFIHKNLKRFLSVELDKFIKNYIFADTNAILSMDESAKRIATFARVFKEQAEVFIDLLSSIEEFQKYLWEKRKMVKRSHYIISSNKVKNTELLKKVLGNRDQIDEWEELGITEKNIKPKLADLKKHSYPIDTKHFDTRFKYEILSQFEDIEEETSGLLVKSENFQALRFLEPKYTDKTGEGRIKSIYIDPPYNTGSDGFVYKDNFKSASWLSMLNDRLEMAKRLMGNASTIWTNLDDTEIHNFAITMNNIFTPRSFVGNIAWKKTSGDNKSIFAFIHDNLIIYGKNGAKPHNAELSVKQLKQYSHFDKKKNDYFALSDYRSKWEKEEREGLYYGIKHPKTGEIIFPNTYSTSSRVWACNEETHKQYVRDNLLWWGANQELKEPKKKRYLSDNKGVNIRSIWDDCGTNDSASQVLKDILNVNFSAPKPKELIQKICSYSLKDKDIILDFFAGSGTTAHAVIELNKKDDKNRKFILVEMNDYFDTIILPRVKKVSFSSEWEKGQAQNKDGYSSIFHYIELEQYDDIIDNLEVVDGMDYSKIAFGYIYEPDKNQINFRMESELKNPLSEDTKFDIFTSLLFHEGLELKKVELKDDVLFAVCTDKSEKSCAIVLSVNEEKAKEKIKSIESDFYSVYTNVLTHNSIHIAAEMFKGR